MVRDFFFQTMNKYLVCMSLNVSYVYFILNFLVSTSKYVSTQNYFTQIKKIKVKFSSKVKDANKCDNFVLNDECESKLSSIFSVKFWCFLHCKCLTMILFRNVHYYLFSDSKDSSQFWGFIKATKLNSLDSTHTDHWAQKYCKSSGILCKGYQTNFLFIDLLKS